MTVVCQQIRLLFASTELSLFHAQPPIRLDPEFQHDSLTLLPNRFHKHLGSVWNTALPEASQFHFAFIHVA